MKVWQKNYALDQEIERFTVGEDYLLDQQLVGYECLASMAHARMLAKVGIFSANELEDVIAVLQEIIRLWEEGTFVVRQSDEDCHTAVENYLTEKLGEVGAKIHTGRSRNDQVLTCLRLYYRDQLAACDEKLDAIQVVLRRIQHRDGQIPFPGYTHTRKAMPTNIHTWIGAFHDALEDDRSLLKLCKTLINRSPLGSAAGFGVPFELDREFVAGELRFPEVQQNFLYCQNSRGKYEAFLLHGLAHIMSDLSRLAEDLIFLSQPELGYVELPIEFCTGSSIMPQKKNPDVLELIRAKSGRVIANELQVWQILSGLISGYHRDLQETKKPVMESFEIVQASLKIMTQVLEGLQVNEERCRQGLTPEVFATEKVYELVKKGVPFRLAYRQVAAELFGKGEENLKG